MTHANTCSMENLDFLMIESSSMAHIDRLHCVHLNVDFETSPKILELRSNVVFKEISDSVELHNVLGLTLQPEFVEFNE